MFVDHSLHVPYISSAGLGLSFLPCCKLRASKMLCAFVVRKNKRSYDHSFLSFCTVICIGVGPVIKQHSHS